MMEQKMVVSGKRKTAVAKATIVSGNGKVTFNKKTLTTLPKLAQLEISEPLVIAKEVLGKLNFDIAINVKSGGNAAKVEASRLAVAKAIVKFTNSEDVRLAFLGYDRNMLVADTRRKEARKPGDSKARARRQTSYR